jgi:hypothetical protein
LLRLQLQEFPATDHGGRQRTATIGGQFKDNQETYYAVREVSVNSAHGAFVFFDGLH